MLYYNEFKRLQQKSIVCAKTEEGAYMVKTIIKDGKGDLHVITRELLLDGDVQPKCGEEVQADYKTFKVKSNNRLTDARSRVKNLTEMMKVEIETANKYDVVMGVRDHSYFDLYDPRYPENDTEMLEMWLNNTLNSYTRAFGTIILEHPKLNFDACVTPVVKMGDNKVKEALDFTISVKDLDKRINEIKSIIHPVEFANTMGGAIMSNIPRVMTVKLNGVLDEPVKKI